MRRVHHQEICRASQALRFVSKMMIGAMACDAICAAKEQLLVLQG